ncbi:MAG: hypothetical protein Q8O83_01000 [bacterium]|nr:hypothetical protein [bacterium]
MGKTLDERIKELPEERQKEIKAGAEELIEEGTEYNVSITLRGRDAADFNVTGEEAKMFASMCGLEWPSYDRITPFGMASHIRLRELSEKEKEASKKEASE